MVSLVKSLHKLGKTPPFSIRTGFQTHPGSLKEMLRIMILPKPRFADFDYRRIHEFTAEDPQGLAHAGGDRWFLSGQFEVFEFSIAGQDLYHPASVLKVRSKNLRTILKDAGLNENDYDHIGDVHWHDGLLFLPIRRKGNAAPHLLLSLSADLDVVAFCKIAGSSDSWCSVNPWNRLLYMPNTQQSDRFDAYDISAFFTVFRDRPSWGREVAIKRRAEHDYRLLQENGNPDTSGGFQGCFFSPNGRLFLPRAQGYSTGWHNFVHVYETLTGVRLDVSKEYDYPATWDEIEGVSMHPSGILYIAVADNDWEALGTDEFWIYAYRSPNSIPI